MTMQQQTQCPISHKPLPEIQMPLGIKGHSGVVYEGQDLVKWLTEYHFKNPCTNEPMAPGMATDLLEPRLLPHTTHKQYLHTLLLLLKLGFLRGPRARPSIRMQSVPLGLLQLWLRLTWLWAVAAMLLPYLAGSSWAVLEVMSFLGLWCFVRPAQARSFPEVLKDLMLECISMTICFLACIGLMRLLLGDLVWQHMGDVTCELIVEMGVPHILQSAVQKKVGLFPTLLNITLNGCARAA